MRIAQELTKDDTDKGVEFCDIMTGRITANPLSSICLVSRWRFPKGTPHLTSIWTVIICPVCFLLRL